MTIVTRSHRTWYGKKRWRWYWLAASGRTISFSATSYPYEQQAWEAAQSYFAQGVTMSYTFGHEDEHFELYAGPRDWN